MTPDDDDPQTLIAPDETPNVGDPVKVRRRETELQMQRREAQDFWRQVFSTEVGRREMWAILSAAGTFEVKFGVGPSGYPQPEASWYHLGEKDMGQRLFMSWMQHDRDGTMLMLSENESRMREMAESTAAAKPRRRTKR